MTREFAFPGTRPRFGADRVVDIEHIALALEVDPASRSIAGTATLRGHTIAAGTETITLDAVELSIDDVTASGRSVGFHHDGAQLRIALPAKLASGAPFELQIEYRGSPRRGMYFVGPDEGYPRKPLQVWTQGEDEDARFWFPCFDAPHEKTTSEIIATVPAPLFAVSNGLLVSDRTSAGKRTLHWKLDAPHSSYLIMLAVGEFAAIETAWRDVPIVYYCERGREAECARTLARTPQMLELFSRRFGMAYPYPRYSQVVVADFIFGGMENTTASILTDAILLDERAATDTDEDSLIAHELAHQWFGDLVTCRDWGEAWLNEGFATYAQYLWREHHEGRDAADVELEDWGDAYFREDRTRYRRIIATKVYEAPFDLFDRHLYEKAGRVVHMLRALLGEDGFSNTLAHYLSKHRHGVVESRDLARAVEDATGKVLDWFFSQWVIDSAGHPELDVRIGWEAETRHVAIAVDQRQRIDPRTPVFRLPTQIRFRIHDQDVDVELEIVEQRQLIRIPLEVEPSQAIFDPGRVLLATRAVDKPQRWWLAELAGATLATDRIAAAQALTSPGGPVPFAALARALAEDPFWGVRGAAATALGLVRTLDARDRLIACLASERDARARRAIVRALGAFVDDDRAGAALGKIVEAGDASYFVEAEACLALGKTRSRHAGTLLRTAAARESYQDVVRANAYRGLGEARDDSALPVLVDGMRWGRPPSGRRAALGALAQLARGRRDREARDTRERSEQMLGDRDYRIQSAAIEALTTIGDPAAIPALRAMVDRELDDRLRRRGKEAIRELEDGARPLEDVLRLRDEVRELRTLAASLRERVEDLEAKRTSKRRAVLSQRPKRGR